MVKSQQTRNNQSAGFITRTESDSLRFSAQKKTADDKAAEAFIKAHAANLQRLGQKVGYASWNLYTMGGRQGERRPGETDTRFRKRLERLSEKFSQNSEVAEKSYRDYTHDAQAFAEAKRLKAANLSNPVVKRQIDLLYLTFLKGNVDPALADEISNRELELTNLYGKFRTRYQEQDLSDTELEERLSQTRDPKEAEALWKAKHEIANFRVNPSEDTLSQKIVALVKLRNQFAQKAGYANYYQMGLAMSEMHDTQVVDLLKSVKASTDPAFNALRAKLDAAAASRFGVTLEEVRKPWLQGGVGEVSLLNDVYQFDPGSYLKGRDPRPILKRAVALMGETVDKIVDKSDLFPRPGKNQHWYLFPLKTPSDIRSLGNVDPQFQQNMAQTMRTLNHEIMGHGLGYALVSPKTPILLRELHGVTTESDAMMMESQIYEADWLTRVLGLPAQEAQAIAQKAEQYKAAHLLMDFRNKFLPIVDFERQMYENPEQDLNQLWREMNHKYLGLSSPDSRDNADWTYKIHFALAPVYYQYYFLAQLMRAQVFAHINTQFKGMLQPQTGAYLRSHRQDGQTLPWEKIVERMTGSSLSSKALEAEFAVLTRGSQ